MIYLHYIVIFCFLYYMNLNYKALQFYQSEVPYKQFTNFVIYRN